MRSVLCAGLVGATVVGLTACGKKDEGAGGPAAPLQTLAGTECVGYGGAAPNFRWTFAEGAFRLEAGGGPIPRELLDELVGEGRDARTIEGEWRLDGMSLMLSKVRADGQPTGRAGKFVAANTGKIRVSIPNRLGEPYVFDEPGSSRK